MKESPIAASPERDARIQAHAERVAREEAEILAMGGVVDDHPKDHPVIEGGIPANAIHTLTCRARRSERGDCPRCGKRPPIPDKTLCWECTNENRVRVRQCKHLEGPR